MKKYRIVIERRPGIRQRWHFVIVAKNGEVVAVSENYRSRADCAATANSLANAALFQVEHPGAL